MDVTLTLLFARIKNKYMRKISIAYYNVIRFIVLLTDILLVYLKTKKIVLLVN